MLLLYSISGMFTGTFLLTPAAQRRAGRGRHHRDAARAAGQGLDVLKMGLRLLTPSLVGLAARAEIGLVYFVSNIVAPGGLLARCTCRPARVLHLLLKPEIHRVDPESGPTLRLL